MERPFDDPLSDSRRTTVPHRCERCRAGRKPARPAAAAPAQRANCGRTGRSGRRSGAGGRPAGEAEVGRHRKEDFAAKLRHTDATHRLNARADRVDIKALLGHESIATARIDVDTGQERTEKVVARLWSANIRSAGTAQSLPCLLSNQGERSTVAKLALKRLVVDALEGDAPIRTAGEHLGALDAESQLAR